MAPPRPVPYFRRPTRYESFQCMQSKTRAIAAAELGCSPERVPNSWYWEKYGPPEAPDPSTFVYFSTSPRPRHKKPPKRPANEEDASFTLPGGPPLTRSFSSFSFASPNAPPKDDIDAEPRAPQTGPTRSTSHRRTRRTVTRDGSVHITEEGTHEANDSSDSDDNSNPPRFTHSTIPEEHTIPTEAEPNPFDTHTNKSHAYQQMWDRAVDLERQAQRESELQRFREQWLRAKYAKEAMARDAAVERMKEKLAREEKNRRIREERRRQAEAEAARRAEAERLARERAERERAEQERRRQLEEQRQQKKSEAEAAAAWYGQYEKTWSEILKADSSRPLIRCDVMRWPVAYPVNSLEEITYDNVKVFVFYPKRPGCESKSKKARVRAEMLKWHPDKYEHTVLSRADPEHHDLLKAAGKQISEHLSALLSEC